MKLLKEASETPLLNQLSPALRKIRDIFENAECHIEFSIDNRNNLMIRYYLFDPDDHSLNRRKIYSYFSFSITEDLKNPDNLYEKISWSLKQDIERELKELINGFTSVCNEIIDEL